MKELCFEGRWRDPFWIYASRTLENMLLSSSVEPFIVQLPLIHFILEVAAVFSLVDKEQMGVLIRRCVNHFETTNGFLPALYI